MKNTLYTFTFFAFAAFANSSVFAQAAPSAQQMIEQLKVQPVPDAPRRTRSLRNLSVEAVDQAADTTPSAPAAPAVKPSLSLQIQFEFNSAQISPVSQQALLNLSTALKAAELSASKFEVEGHTDAKGNDAYNLKLSQQRAEAVQQFLVYQGVAINRLMASGKGSTHLANAGNPLAAENRRVRIVNLD
jgi:outer membrane protein OmpA-like peptidoglycan-associated protein